MARKAIGTGRDARGRFAAGNLGGPGRPARVTEAAYLASLSDAVPLDVWQRIVERARDDALGGDARARAWLAGLLLGKEPARLSQLARDDLLGVTPADRTRVSALRVVEPSLQPYGHGLFGPTDDELAVQVARAREEFEAQTAAMLEEQAGVSGEP